MADETAHIDATVATPAVETPAADEQRIPKHRFDEVNSALREFKELGLSPGDIREMAAEYRTMVEKSLEAPAAPAVESKISAERRKELRDGLLEVMPELAQIPGLVDAITKTKVTADTAEQQQVTQLNERASDLCGTLFEASGFSKDTHASLYARLEHVIANDIYTNPDKAKRFYRGDLKVVRETYQEYADDILTHVVKPAKPPTKDLSFLPGKKGLSLPASALDDKVKSGKPLTRDEMSQLHRETFSIMQG